MILRLALYIPITIFFLWEYKKNKKNFKLLIFFIIGITFFGSTNYFTSIDSRLQLTALIICIILTLRVLYGYYKEYKLEKFKNKKYLRELREKNRIKQSDELMEKIIEAKNESIKNKSSNYEISLEMSENYDKSNKTNKDINRDDENLEDEYIIDFKNPSEEDLNLKERNNKEETINNE